MKLFVLVLSLAASAGAAPRISAVPKARALPRLPGTVLAPPSPVLQAPTPAAPPAVAPAVAFSDGVGPLQLNADKPLESAARPLRALKKAPALRAARSRETAAARGGLTAVFDGSAFAASGAQDLKRRLIAGLSRAAGRRMEVEPDRGWFTHGRARHRLEYWNAQGEGTPIAARFGPLFFVEEAATQELPAPLQEDLSPRLIRLDGLAQSGLFSPLAMYSLTAAAMLLDRDLRGLVFRDAGAGDGLLSLIATKRGAKRVDLIEYDAAGLERARRHLELNGLKEGRGFRLIQADLTDTAGTLRKLPDPELPSVLSASIGNWTSDYTATNADAFALIPGLPGLQGLLAAGYASGAPGGGLHHMRWDQELLRLLGWRRLPRRGSRGFKMADLWPENRNNYFHLSFAAEPDSAGAAEPAEFERALARRRSQHRSQLSLEALRRSRR